mmetsp:Transcript_34102/g.78720  ORF Transcript_34102/g.78720 Transcript_34102/m.78720 type:complete len:427 (-) Transcript_34102:1636-2916(-)
MIRLIAVFRTALLLMFAFPVGGLAPPLPWTALRRAAPASRSSILHASQEDQVQSVLQRLMELKRRQQPKRVEEEAAVEESAVAEAPASVEESPESVLANVGPSAPTSANGNPLRFDLTTALFLSGLAFDTYNEPTSSSRWEKGSRGLNVAFMSTAYTASLYAGVLQATAVSCSDLPDDRETAESLLTGSGVDAYILAAILEDDRSDKTETEAVAKKFGEGVVALETCSHVGRSTTVWANWKEGKNDYREGPSNRAYYEPSTWTRGGKAFWGPNETTMNIYVSNPLKSTLVLSICDEDRTKEDEVVGSTAVRLTSLLKIGKQNVGKAIFGKALANVRAKTGTGETKVGDEYLTDANSDNVAEWEGDIKMTSRPRKKDKGGNIATGVAVGAMVAGPMGAAAGALVGNLIEEQVKCHACDIGSSKSHPC